MMSFRAPTVITASALGVLLVVGAVDQASAGHGYGYGGPGHYGYHPGYAAPYGYGYRAYRGHPTSAQGSHPMVVYPGGMPMQGHDKPYWKDGGCEGTKKAGYLMKTGMHQGEEKAQAAPEATGDIVDVAVAAGSFETLVAAVKAAGLVETLKGKGPFTVFAPTDEAFAKIPAADLEALLADKEKLTAVLTYHVVPGKVMAADVAGLESAKTVQGASIVIDTTEGVKVDDAKVVKTDIMASNGVIHVIDTVIMPKSE